MSNSILGGGIPGFNPTTIQQRLDERFQQLDKDGNGGLSRQEMAADARTRAGSVDKIMQTFDADGDGEITRDEQNAVLDRRINQLQLDDYMKTEETQQNTLVDLLSKLRDNTENEDFQQEIDDFLTQLKGGEGNTNDLLQQAIGLINKNIPPLDLIS